ncbi:hypothetical protein J8F10_32975 [Gemmata sp. G18]|uniref:Isopropylmalate dehydrogenase-like domain-containing protein n=1 Tax=Gemmata palustris TaxID=2822762 RepID=A0ABS5C256_9BACT|nr:hypothetical protein [Gemmata palustris]
MAPVSARFLSESPSVEWALPPSRVQETISSGAGVRAPVPAGDSVGGSNGVIGFHCRKLGLFGSARPVNTLPGIKTPYKKIDLIVVRENTEGLYAITARIRLGLWYFGQSTQ